LTDIKKNKGKKPNLRIEEVINLCLNFKIGNDYFFITEIFITLKFASKRFGLPKIIYPVLKVSQNWV